MTINPRQQGLLAPASFFVGGKQFVAAVHGGTSTLVGYGNIPGLAAAPASPNEWDRGGEGGSPLVLVS